MAPHRDEVFVAGGQPTYTYVARSEEHVELKFARAVATPNQIVSLSGPSKTGKTVLCKRTLGDRQFVWVDGGQVTSAGDFWRRVMFELNLPNSVETTHESESKIAIQADVPMLITGSGSQLYKYSEAKVREIHSLGGATAHMLQKKIMLVIDDFHYIPDTVRIELMRNLKGSVFNGLKVVLLSVTHRVFDALKSESELTGRFIASSLPHWTQGDLANIPFRGFDALGTDCPHDIVDILCNEAQESPFLMQKFCWDVCFDLGIEHRKFRGKHVVPVSYDTTAMFRRLSLDAGLPIYQRLAAGPQNRKPRQKRKLRSGGTADIYEALLLALAMSGPKSVITYNELRDSLGNLLAEQIPQKHETTSALIHLTRISKEIGAESAVDWDPEQREVNLADPYLRFYLRWQIRSAPKG